MLNFIYYIKKINHLRIDAQRKLIVYVKLNILCSISKLRRAKKKFVDCKTILILMPGMAVGDGVLLSGLIQRLREVNYTVDVIIDERTRDLFESKIVEVDNIIYCKDVLNRRYIKACLKYDILLQLFDPVVYDHNPQFNLRYLKLIARIKFSYLIGFNHDNDHLYNINLLMHESGHISARCSEILTSVFKLPNTEYKYSVNLKNQIVDEVKTLVSSRKPVITINLGSLFKERRFSVSFIDNLLSDLSLDKYVVFVFNFYDDSVISKHNGVYFNAFPDLDHVVSILSVSTLVITPDTSFVHFCNALDVNCICVYNNRIDYPDYDNNVRWGPNYSKALQILTPQCQHTSAGDDIRELDYYSVKHLIFNKLNQCTTFK